VAGVAALRGVVSTAQAYNAGVAAGAASAGAYAVGTVHAALPAGCTYEAIGTAPYYHCTSGVWFSPAYGANGVYYRVVPMP
jgi:hypothetical protein